MVGGGLFIVFGVVCVVIVGGKRIELYRIFIVKVDNWRWTDIRRGVAVVREADDITAINSDAVSLVEGRRVVAVRTVESRPERKLLR